MEFSNTAINYFIYKGCVLNMKLEYLLVYNSINYTKVKLFEYVANFWCELGIIRLLEQEVILFRSDENNNNNMIKYFFKLH